MSRVFLISLLTLALGILSTASFAEIDAEEAKTGPLTFCRFGPKVKILEPRKDPLGSGCPGGAKIQGVFWECTTADRVESKIQDFRKSLTDIAIAQCKKFCANRAPGCEGKMDTVFRCGLQTDREDAVIMGKKLGCRKDCTGKAFAYCSLYNIGFLTDDVQFMETQPTNCHCFKP
jgi:hypothetical protein